MCQSESLRDAETRCDAETRSSMSDALRSSMSDALLWPVRRDGLVWPVLPPPLQPPPPVMPPPLQPPPLLASRRQIEARRLTVESRVQSTCSRLVSRRVQSTSLSPLLVYARVSRAAGVCGRVSRAAGVAGGLGSCISFVLVKHQ